MISELGKMNLERLIALLEQNKNSFTIDADTHPSDLKRLGANLRQQFNATPNYYQGRPISVVDLLTEMEVADVDMALTWQNPSVLEYSNDQESNYVKLRQANEDILTFGRQHPTKFISAGWTDPKALGVSLASLLVEECILNYGFPIVKMNPAQNSFFIDSDEVLTLVEKIISLGAIPAFHYGGDTQYTPASGLENVARTFSKSRIIAVHMGGGGSHYVDGDEICIQTRELGLKYPNLFFILSAKRDCHIESDLITYTLAGEPFSSNIACGSDAPYGKPAWNFGGFEKMFQGLRNGHAHPDPRMKASPHAFTEEIIQGFRGRNFAELVISSAQNVLEKNKSLKLIL